MSLEHFRDYCKAFRFSTKENIKKYEKIQEKRGTFYDSEKTFYYVENLKFMKALAKQNNIYAIKELEDETYTG